MSLACSAPNSPVEFAACIKDKERLQQNSDDPLVIHAWVQNRAGVNTIIGGKLIADEAHIIKTPWFGIHGDEDRVTLPRGTEMMQSAMVNNKDKTVHFVRGGYHEIFYDTGFEEHLMKVIEWMSDKAAAWTSRCPSANTTAHSQTI
jgi:alpha-beta hydrolase superfamily lysophospholipase